MTRKALPRTMVASRNPTVPVRRPTCAERTASAIVRLEKMSTAVLIAPSVMSRWWDAPAKASGYAERYTMYAEERPAEEEDLRDQEHPHPQRRGLVLLIEALEVMRQGRVRLAVWPSWLAVADQGPVGFGVCSEAAMLALGRGAPSLRLIRHRAPLHLERRVGVVVRLPCHDRRLAGNSPSAAARASATPGPSRPTGWPAPACRTACDQMK